MDFHLPDPVISRADGTSPEDEVLLADAVGMALQVVLETLTPAERLAFVLHDMFGLSFDEIAPVVGRSPATARQLASRARRRVRGPDVHIPDTDIGSHREVVEAFFAAAHRGDLEALVAVLDPDVVVRTDGGTAFAELSGVRRGAADVARQTVAIANPAIPKLPVLVNGAAGVLAVVDGQPGAVMAFTVRRGKVVEINAIIDPERLGRLNLPAFD